MAAKTYILLYNLSMTVGWILVLFRLLAAKFSSSPIYESVEIPLKVFQTGALLEILHSLTGLIRAPASTTALQVASRLLLVWGVADPIEAVRTNKSFATMVLAWSLTEIPRYSYFSVSAAVGAVPFWLTFVRYSTFLPLYPVGATSEWLTLFAALPEIAKSRLFSVEMPNRYNFSFDYYVLCLIALTVYIPGLPYMYSHMLRQRRKYVVNPAKKIVKSQ